MGSYSNKIDNYKRFDIVRNHCNGTIYFSIEDKGCYVSPEICKRVIDTYLKRTGQWDKYSEPVETKIKERVTEYSNKSW